MSDRESGKYPPRRPTRDLYMDKAAQLLGWENNYFVIYDTIDHGIAMLLMPTELTTLHRHTLALLLAPRQSPPKPTRY